MHTTSFLFVQIRVLFTAIIVTFALTSQAVGMPFEALFQEYSTYHVPRTALGPNGEIIGRIKIGRLVGQSEADFAFFSQRVTNILNQIWSTDSGLQVITDLNSLVLSNTNGSGGTVVFMSEPPRGSPAVQTAMINDPAGFRASASVNSVRGAGIGSYIQFAYNRNQSGLDVFEITNVFHELGHAHSAGFGYSAPPEAGPQDLMHGTVYKLEEMENTGLVPVHRDRITENDFRTEYRQKLNLTAGQLPNLEAYAGVSSDDYLFGCLLESDRDFEAWLASLKKVNGKDELLDYLCRDSL